MIIFNHSISVPYTHTKLQLRKFSFKTEEENLKKLLGREKNLWTKRKIKNRSSHNKKQYLLLILKHKLFLLSMDDTSDLLQ